MLTLYHLFSFPGHSRENMLISCTEISQFSKNLNKNCFLKLLIRNNTFQYYHAKIILVLLILPSSSSFFCLMQIPVEVRNNNSFLFCLRAENYFKNMVEFLPKLWEVLLCTCTVNQHDVVQYNWEEKYKSPSGAGHKNQRIFYQRNIFLQIHSVFHSICY